MTKARDLADRTSADLTAVTAGTGISVTNGTGPIPTVTNTVATGFDAKGDLIVGTGADTFSKLTVASTAGYLLSVDSAEATGLKWAAPGGGDYVKISAATYTNQTSINIDNIFSSTYKSYLIVIESAFCVTAGSALQMKWRYSTTTDGNVHYGVLRGYDYGGGTYTTNNSGAAFHTLNQNPGTATPGSRTIINVTGADGSSGRPVFFGNSTSFNSGELDIIMGWSDTARIYTGINLSVATGNITATVQVYGRKA
jgi:hypothetical protein